MLMRVLSSGPHANEYFPRKIEAEVREISLMDEIYWQRSKRVILMAL